LYGEAAVLLLQPAESRCSKRHPAWPGLSITRENGGGGAKFVLMSFVHAARNPKSGLPSAAVIWQQAMSFSRH